MTTMQDISELLQKQTEDFETFKSKHLARLDNLEEEVKSAVIKSNRAGLFGGGGHVPSGAELKHLNDAVRALLGGDQVRANQAFVEAKAMSTGSGPDGGYVVVPTISSTMTKVMAEISPFYRLARVIPIEQGDSFDEPIDRAAAQAVWVGETQSRPDTATPSLGEFTVFLKEITAMPKVTQKLIDVARINIVDWLTGKVGEAFGVTEGSAFHIGDGVAKPRGILEYPTATTADATRPWGTIQHIATGASAAFPTSSTSVNPADVLVDVVSAMKAQYRAGAGWLMNRNTAGAVRKLKDAEGRHVWVDSLVEGQPSLLLGYRVDIDEDMPDISAGSLSIAFANLQKAYTIIEQPGIKFLTDPYTDKPNVRLYAYRRVGGGMNNSEAIKLLKFS